MSTGENSNIVTYDDLTQLMVSLNTDSISGVWTVYATDGFDTTSAAETFQLTIMNITDYLPDTPEILYPARDKTFREYPLLQWSETGNTLRYSLQISNSDNFDPLVMENNELTDTSYIFDTIQETGNYYWRVKAVNSYGAGIWSETGSFNYIRNSPPNSFHLLSPANEFEFVLVDPGDETTLSFSWEESTDDNQDSIVYFFDTDSSLGLGSETTSKNSLEFSHADIVQLLDSVNGYQVSGYWRVFAWDGYDTTLTADTEFMLTIKMQITSAAEDLLPDQFDLKQNYPNPFNPRTNIKFDVPERSHVSIVIYDALGRVVDNLINSEMNAGRHEVIWNGSGKVSGVYFYTMQAGNYIMTKKLVLIK
jgi:hypothetical protein